MPPESLHTPLALVKSSPMSLSEGLMPEHPLLATVEQAKRMWEATFDAVVDPVMIVDKDFRVVRANLAAAASAGMPIRELIESRCYEAFARRSSPCEGCPMAGASPAASQRAALRPYADGREFMVSLFPLKLAQEAGEAMQFVLQYQDLSAIRQLEAKLLQSEKMAALGLFASGLAHDINNPLAGILAFAQLAQQNLEDPQLMRQDLEQIEIAALRCKKILEDLLSMSRPAPLHQAQSLDLEALLRQLIPNLSAQFAAKHPRLKLLLPPLPRLWGDPQKLERVFTNLITNALQALPSGGEMIVTAEAIAETVVLEIRDKGVGIAPEHLDKVFDPYFSTKTGQGGTGLGLTLSAHLVREHGGEIEVAREGCWTVFRVRLPVAKTEKLKD